MRKPLANWILSAFCLYILSFLFSGIYLSGFVSAMIAAVVMGFVNIVIKPIISILSLPITFITLGLFSLVINAFMLMITSFLVPGFTVSGFGTAFFAAIVLSVLNTLFVEKR